MFPAFRSGEEEMLSFVLSAQTWEIIDGIWFIDFKDLSTKLLPLKSIKK